MLFRVIFDNISTIRSSNGTHQPKREFLAFGFGVLLWEADFISNMANWSNKKENDFRYGQQNQFWRSNLAWNIFIFYEGLSGMLLFIIKWGAFKIKHHIIWSICLPDGRRLCITSLGIRTKSPFGRRSPLWSIIISLIGWPWLLWWV